MFCSCCLTNLEVKYSAMYDANLCPKCEADIDDATDAAHEHDIESGDHADLEDEEDEELYIDDSDLWDEEDWDEYGDYLDCIDDAEHASLYAEDHDYE